MNKQTPTCVVCAFTHHVEREFRAHTLGMSLKTISRRRFVLFIHFKLLKYTKTHPLQRRFVLFTHTHGRTPPPLLQHGAMDAHTEIFRARARHGVTRSYA